MPNRKSFDEREKYDHSQHSTEGRETGDLSSVPDRSQTESVETNARRSGEPGTGQTRNSR